MYRQISIEPVDYLMIGHITRDITPDGPRLGGTATYSSLMARALGLRVGIVTSWGNELPTDPFANIPIIDEVPLPGNVLKVKAKKIGLQIELERLSQLRGERMRRMGGAQLHNYSSKSALMKELNYCEKVYRKVPSLNRIDVTNRSIEETAEWITHNVL